MKIDCFNGGFKETLDSDVIREILFFYDGLCKVYFCNGTVKELNTVCDGYNSQFGVPISPDGKILFVSSWETGLHAYNIDSGKELWHFKSTRIKAVYAYDTYLIAIRYCKAVIKLDIADGTKIGEMTSGTIEHSFSVTGPFVLIDTYRGKLSVIDTASLSVFKQYPSKTVNPLNAISFMIRETYLKRNRLTICGLEGPRPFNRVIDPKFLPNESRSLLSKIFHRTAKQVR